MNFPLDHFELDAGNILYVVGTVREGLCIADFTKASKALGTAMKRMCDEAWRLGFEAGLQAATEGRAK